MTARPQNQRPFTAELQQNRGRTPNNGKRHGATTPQASSAASAFAPGAADGGDADAGRHERVMAALAVVLDEVRTLKSEGDHVTADFKREAIEAARLKTELDGLSETIERTKRDIAVLSRTSASEERLQDMTHQLDAVVRSTEEATNTILECAEQVQELSDNLILHLTSDDERAALEGIQAHVITIFEACNFQDLSGQRISKVINALKEVEERVTHMMELFGGVQAIDEVASGI